MRDYIPNLQNVNRNLLYKGQLWVQYLKTCTCKVQFKGHCVASTYTSKIFRTQLSFSWCSQRLQGPLFSNMRSFFFDLLLSQSSVHFLQLLINSYISFPAAIAFCSFTKVHLTFFSSGGGEDEGRIHLICPPTWKEESKRDENSKPLLWTMLILQWKCFPKEDVDFSALLLLAYILILNFIHFCTLKKLKTDFQHLLLNYEKYRSTTTYYTNKMWVNDLHFY